MSAWKPSVCPKDCPDACGLLVRTEGERVVAVRGDPDHPFTRGFICQKALSFPEHVHSPDRIVQPLVRTGPKGSGRFRPVSWDQALSLLRERYSETVSRHGAQAVLPYSFAGHMGLVQRNAGHAFFHRLGASRLAPTICSPAASAGFKASLGAGPSTSLETAAESDYIIIWGSDALVTNLHAWPFFSRARRRGARLVVIDPYRNRTAKRADLHLMLKPGSDAALALAMMHVLLAEDMVDRGFIREHTLGYNRLAARAREWPPARAAEVCGLDAEDIVRVARGYGRARAPFIRTGWGPARQLKGGMAMRAIALLPALTGALHKPGGGVTRHVGGAPSDLTALTRPDLCPPGTRTVNMVQLGDALTELRDPPIKLLHNYLANPAAAAPQSAKVMAGLEREDLFTAVHEMFMTDTALRADLILPSACFLEETDLYKSYGHNYIQMARPVIPPPGQARPLLAVFQELAHGLGFGEEVFNQSEEYFIAEFLAQDSPQLQGLDRDALWAGRPVKLNIPDNPYADGFATPSGKVEFYSQAMADQGLDPLPGGEPSRDPDGAGRYPLQLITPPHPCFLNSSFNEIPGQRKKAGPAGVLIHPADARERGIGPGALVRIFNDRGSCLLHAEPSPDVRPGLLAARGIHWPRHAPGGRGVNQLTSQRLTDMGQTCAFHCNLVEIEPA